MGNVCSAVTLELPKSNRFWSDERLKKFLTDHDMQKFVDCAAHADFIVQSTDPAARSSQRNVELIEVFSGKSRIHGEARKKRMTSDCFDVLHRPKANDINTVPGLLHAMKHILRLKPSGLAWFGVPCCLLVFISLGTSRKGIWPSDLFGNVSLDCVRCSLISHCSGGFSVALIDYRKSVNSIKTQQFNTKQIEDTYQNQELNHQGP